METHRRYHSFAQPPEDKAKGNVTSYIFGRAGPLTRTLTSFVSNLRLCFASNIRPTLAAVSSCCWRSGGRVNRRALLCYCMLKRIIHM